MGTLLNRRRYMGGRRLPYDAQIEYLESTGTQWINTGIIFKKFLYLNFDAQYTNNFTSTQVFAGPSANGGCWVGNVNNKKWGVSANPQNNDSSIKNRIELVYETSTTKLYVNGSSSGSVSRSTNPSNPIAIFNAYTGGFPSNARVYRFRIEDWTDTNNKIVLFDAFPVRVGTIGYMYDKVSKSLLGNAGTGDFILGNDKTT